MSSKNLRNIKHAQRESLFKREIILLLQQIATDDPQLQSVFVTRVSLSANRGSLHIFLSSSEANEQTLTEKLRRLVLYKPSLRNSIAKMNHARTVPDIFFKIDDLVKKQQRMDELFEQIKKDELL